MRKILVALLLLVGCAGDTTKEEELKPLKERREQEKVLHKEICKCDTLKH